MFFARRARSYRLIQPRYQSASRPVMLIVIVYGSAMITILPYDSRISGASAEVSRNRNAAWPFGVATLGMLVPVLMATASASNCSRVISPALEHRVDFADVHGGHEDVVTDHREKAVRDIEQCFLCFALVGHDPVDDG